MILTVINRQRLFGHKPGEVFEIEDSAIVRGLIARGRLDLVDPPSLEIVDGGKSNPQTSSVQELPDGPKRTRSSGSRKASAKRSEESSGDSPGGYGGPEGQSEGSEDHTEGVAGSENN